MLDLATRERVKAQSPIFCEHSVVVVVVVVVVNLHVIRAILCLRGKEVVPICLTGPGPPACVADR
jgi:hypothetical protein